MDATDERQGRLSSDGLWRWDGAQWLPTSTPGQMPAPVAARPLPAIAGGIVAVLALPFILAGCILPYVNWTDTSNGATSSIFNAGYSGGFWFAVEPIAVILCALPAAIVLIAVKHRVARAVAAGVLLAFGLQTITMFAGYSLGRYFEVANKLGLDPYTDVGLKTPVMEGPGEDKPLMSGGHDRSVPTGGNGGFILQLLSSSPLLWPWTEREVGRSQRSGAGIAPRRRR